MTAYKARLTITDPDRLVLTGLPFRAGQRVEIAITTEDSAPPDRIADVRALLRETQPLPEARRVTEDEIAAEIAAYRAGR